MELEQQVERAVEEERRTLGTTRVVDVDRRLPVKMEEEKKESLRIGEDEVLRMQEQLKQLQEESTRTAKALTRAQDELLDRDRTITNLKRIQVPLGHVTATPELQVEVEDLRRALNVAQDTMEQLKVSI